MIQAVTQFGADSSSSGIGALGINGQALLIQLVTFVLAFLVLRQYAFKPILKILQERRDTIDKGVTLGEEMQKERAKLDKTVADELHAARAKADGILAEAQDTARTTVREAEDKARGKADGIVKDAEERAAQEVKRARKALESELVGLISDATEAIIDEKVDTKKDAALIDKALAGQRA
jgi:F-type H+-transporting ATPase subunit b